LSIEDGAARILIEDRGPGIPEQLLHRACEPFFRLNKSDRSSGPGAGLGLAIAKEIIGRSSGELKLANSPKGGLIQEVRLPLAKLQPQPHNLAGA
jgi:signal transduction histidine kinase